ncbi:MAG TPA: L,D-transpeptidase [Gemmatimonadaceae bacterium]|nr:L,D-transpeptidase [Gemmatimonadaceae bacterium]
MGVRYVSTMATAALALAVAACTIEEASDKRAADSAAAATAKGEVQTSASSGAVASPQPAPGMAQTAPTAGMTGDSVGSAMAPAGAATTPATGNLSPDSVDVGRTSKSTLLPAASTRIEVDLNARKLTVFDGDRSVGTYRVAVGSKEWPTQTGEWSITQVVWNPEWIPPKDEAWAEAKDRKAPGASDNPLGRAQLVYDPPRTVHGTNDPASIGKAVSHGSIRLANADVVKLARQLMEATGVKKDDAWYRQVQQNRTEKEPVDLPQRVPIRVF